jgi:hypothetical protein
MPTAQSTEYIFFSNAHGTFSRMDHMLSHKISTNKFECIEVIQNMTSECNEIINE